MDTTASYFKNHKQAYKEKVLQLYDSKLVKVIHKMLPLYVVEIAIEEAILQQRSHRIDRFLAPVADYFMDVNELLAWSDTRQREADMRHSRQQIRDKRNCKVLDEWIELTQWESEWNKINIFDRLTEDSIYLF